MVTSEYQWQEILKKEGLSNWRVKGAADGYCQGSTKTIFCMEGDIALFLHEVAHAIRGECPRDKTGHDSIWGDIFTGLVRKYLRI